MEKTLDVANIKIDVKKPEISFLGATTNNEGYNNYANKTHTVVIKLSAVEENLKDNKLWKDVKFLLDNESATKIKASVHSSYYRDTISYEINEEEDIQDTKDGKNIDEFDFEICTIGK